MIVCVAVSIAFNYILDLNMLNEKLELQKFVSEIYQMVEDDDGDNPFINQ
jgi:hypothetical protein